MNWIDTNAYLFLLAYIMTYFICLLGKSMYDPGGYNTSAMAWKKRIALAFIIAIPFSLLCAYRSFDTGYDTPNYFAGVFEAKHGLRELGNGGFHVLYERLLYTCSYYTDGNVKVWLFVMAVVSLFFFNYTLSLWSRKHTFFTLGSILYLLYISPIMLDQSRQFMAVGITMLAFWYLYKNKIIIFVLWLLVASLFHESTLGLLPLVILGFGRSKGTLRTNIVLLVTIVISLFLTQYFVQLILQLLPTKFEYISSQAHAETTGFAWVADLMPLFYCMFAYYYHSKYRQSGKPVLEACALSAIIFRLSGYSSFFIMRMSYYGMAMSILLFIETMNIIPHRKSLKWEIGAVLIFATHWYIDFLYLGLNGAIPYNIAE